MRPDPELKEITQAIVRKEAAKKEVDERTSDYFDLEIMNLRDDFEIRTMLLLRHALLQDSPEALLNFFITLKNSANSELFLEVTASLFEQLVKHVFPKLSREAKEEIIFALSVFDDTLAQE